MYDAQIGRWHVMDAVAESYFSYSPYNFVRNNPILRVDPNGKWDVTVHLYNNREKYGYGVAIVTNKGGDEIYRFRVRGQGVNGSNRAKKGADTPTGTYNIPRYAWINGANATPKKRKSYGKNFRLVMNPESGEIKDTKRKLIRIHGGRQEIYDEENDVWLEVPTDELAKTEGCLRASDADMIGFKNAIDNLRKIDKTDTPGKVFVFDDLEQKITPNSDGNKVEVNVTYSVPEGEKDYWKEFINNWLNNLNHD
jgi:hypothetical protein